MPSPLAELRNKVQDALEELNLQLSASSAQLLPITDVDCSIALLDRLNEEDNAWSRSLIWSTRKKEDSQYCLISLVSFAVQAPISLFTSAYKPTQLQPHPMTLHAHIKSLCPQSRGP